MIYNYIFAKHKKIITSLCLSASLLSYQPLTAFWGLNYLSSTHGTIASCASQLKQSAKIITTSAAAGLALGLTIAHAAGNNSARSTALIAVAGLLICHSIYKYWDQDHQRTTELHATKAQLEQLTDEQAGQKAQLAQAQVVNGQNLEKTQQIDGSLQAQTLTIAQLRGTLDTSSTQLSALDHKTTATSAVLNAGLAATKKTITETNSAQEHQLAAQIATTKETIAGLNAQVEDLAAQQTACQKTVTGAVRQLDALATRQAALLKPRT